MKKYTVIIILCLALALFNIGCGYGEEGEHFAFPSSYTFNGVDASYADFYDDEVLEIKNTDDGVAITAKFSFSSVCIKTNNETYYNDYLVSGYYWYIDGINIHDILEFQYGSVINLKEFKMNKIGQVSYKMKKAGLYLFCSADEVVEICELLEPCVYHVTKESDIHAIYEVQEND